MRANRNPKLRRVYRNSRHVNRMAVSVYQLFGDQITPEIEEAARLRLTNGGNLAHRKDLGRGILKLILLLVREVNPVEHFTREERSILIGVNKETITKMDNDKQFTHVVNPFR